MTLKIYLIRHGESEANKEGVHQGQIIDSSLTEKGRKQAEIIAERLKEENVKIIYSSDLNRALETAKVLEKILGLKITLDKRLREFNFGEFDKNPERKEELFKEFYHRELEKGMSKYDIRPFGGENIWDLIKRVKSFLEDLEKCNGTIIVYSHGGTIEIALNLIEGRDKEKDGFRRYYQENTAINEATFEKGVWEILRINDSDHIKNIKPNKRLYKNQKEICKKIIKRTLEEIDPPVKEAYLFGSTIKKKFGIYIEKFSRHKGSNIDVLVTMRKKSIPLNWKFIKQERFWTIYEIGKIKIGKIEHRIDFYVIKKYMKKGAIERLNILKERLEKIK